MLNRNMQKRPLRCYAEGNDSGWEATCVDLDLTVQGDSFDEVFHALNESICAYLETVMDLPEADQQRLLNRRAPFLTRVQLALAHFRYFVLGRTTAQARHDFVAPADLCLP